MKTDTQRFRLALGASFLLHGLLLGSGLLRPQANVAMPPRPRLPLQARLLPPPELPPVPRLALDVPEMPAAPVPVPPAAAAPPPPVTPGSPQKAASSEPAKTPKPADPVRQAQAQIRQTLLYPPEAVAQGLEGEVLVMLFLDGSGNVIAARVEESSGEALLDGAAVRAARQIRALDTGSQHVLLPVRFRLEK